MIQLTLSNEEYRTLYFALGIAENATRIEAQNVEAMGLHGIANELQLESRTYKSLQEFITNNKEVL